MAPDAEVRTRFRELLTDDHFLEVFVDTPIEICRTRDRSGLYERADRGEVVDFPGVDYTYDRATTFDIRIDGGSTPVEASVRQIVEVLTARGMLRG